MCVFPSSIRLRDQDFIRFFLSTVKLNCNDQLVVHVEFGSSVRGDPTRPDSSNAMFITCQVVSMLVLFNLLQFISLNFISEICSRPTICQNYKKNVPPNI